MNRPIEVETVIESRDLNSMLVMAMVFANRAVLPIILVLSLLFSLVNWKLMKLQSLAMIFLMWIAFAVLIVYLLLRRSHSVNKGEGAMSFLNKTQYFRFYEDHFSLKAPGSEDFVDVPYSQVLQVKSVPNYLMIGLEKKHYLFLRKKDLQGRLAEIRSLIEDYKRSP